MNPRLYSYQIVQQLLSLFGVNIGAVTYAYDPVIPLGYVVTNILPYLYPGNEGLYLDITVSNGPAPAAKLATVPNVVGMYYVDAQAAILTARLLTAVPNLVISTSFAPTYVIGQSLTAGSTQPEQTTMQITVAGFTTTNSMGVPVPVL